jgi:glycosyltransferase involved in cell wall biosynthesis
VVEKKQLVSIIVRTKDRPKLLRRALQSIADQSYRPIEVVLVNDGGCDLPEEELRQGLGDVSLNYIRIKENKGRAYAGNVGIENAKGDYVGFLDDDDELYPEHVDVLAGYLDKSEVKVAYTDSLIVYEKYDAESQEIKSIKQELIYSQDFDYDMLIFENYIPFMCLMFDREVLINSGGFDTRLNLYEDWDLLINIGSHYPFHHIKETTSNYNQWSDELQIAQRNRDPDFLKESYLQVVSKHIHKIKPQGIHYYVSRHAEVKELKNKFYNFTSLLNEREAHISNLESQVKERDVHISSLESQVRESETRVNSLESQVRESETRVNSLESLVAERTHHLQEKEHYIRLIHSGHGWKLLTKYFKARDLLMPEGTKRRLFFKLIFKMLLNPKEVLGHLNKTNIRKFFYYLKAVDPLTVEEKCNQKLSYELGDNDNDPGKGIEHNRSPQATDIQNDYPPYEINTGGEEYIPLLSPDIPESDIKLIAFYLPQFHPIKDQTYCLLSSPVSSD